MVISCLLRKRVAEGGLGGASLLAIASFANGACLILLSDKH
jgi:hypothetical protein